MSFITNLGKLNHETIKQFMVKIGKTPAADPVFNAYHDLLSFVQRSIAAKDTTALIGIAHTVYGWMPTMLDNINKEPLKNDKNVKDLWNSIRSGSLDTAFLETIKKITNDSTTGASKLLHFINPDDYAIVDSHIYREILQGSSPYYNISIKNYRLYMEKLKELKADTQKMTKIKSVFHKNNKAGEMPDLRYLELALWYTGRK